MVRRFLSGVLLCTTLTAYADTITLKGSDVNRVYDGDTFYITIPNVHPVFGQNIGVRILGIDTPEMRSKCGTEPQQDREEYLAKEAKALLNSQFKNAKVIELKGVKRDKYFRLLAEVHVDGRDVTQLLVSNGLADPYDGGTKVGWCNR